MITIQDIFMFWLYGGIVVWVFVLSYNYSWRISRGIPLFMTFRLSLLSWFLVIALLYAVIADYLKLPSSDDPMIKLLLKLEETYHYLDKLWMNKKDS